MNYHDPWGKRERIKALAIIIGLIAIIALLLAFTDLAEAYSDTPVPGTVNWAGRLHEGRQLVNFTRADTGGWMQLPVSIRPGAPLYKRGDPIWIFRASGRVLGIGRR